MSAENQTTMSNKPSLEKPDGEMRRSFIYPPPLRWEDEVNNLGKPNQGLDLLWLDQLTVVDDAHCLSSDEGSPEIQHYPARGSTYSGEESGLENTAKPPIGCHGSQSTLSTDLSSLRSLSAGSRLEFDFHGFDVKPLGAAADHATALASAPPPLVPAKPVTPPSTLAESSAHRWLALRSPEVDRWEVSYADTCQHQRLPLQRLCDALIGRVQAGFHNGYLPCPVDSPCTGGVYYTRCPRGRIVGVLKPADEEPYAVHNSQGYRPRAESERGQGIKGGVPPGHGVYREVVAFLLDHDTFAGVPRTALVALRPRLRASEEATAPLGHRLASLQAYSSHECSAEDVGPSLLYSNAVHRIAILDIRLCNKDRHPGNVLLRTQVSPSSDDACNGEGDPESSTPSGMLSRSIDSAAFRKAKLVRAKSTGARALPPRCRETTRRPLQRKPRLIRRKSKSFHEHEFTDSASAKVKLVPIDHGMCLPSVFHLEVDDFAWMSWRKCREALVDDEIDYIASLDPFADCELIRTYLGDECIRDEHLLTLVICTRFLQISVLEFNKSLHEVGEMMCSQGGMRDGASCSLLQEMVGKAGLPSTEEICVLDPHPGYDRVTPTKQFLIRFEGNLRAKLSQAAPVA